MFRPIKTRSGDKVKVNCGNGVYREGEVILNMEQQLQHDIYILTNEETARVVQQLTRALSYNLANFRKD
jgi:hypothetical protein